MHRLLSLAALMAVSPLATACGSSDDATDPVTGPGLLPPPSQGLQLNMVTELEPGSEVEHCQFFQVPEGEDLWVKEAPTRYSEGSHHVLVYRTEYTEIPTEDVNGNSANFEGVWDCSDGIQTLIDTGDVAAGSQNADGASLLNFPDNVAMKIPAGTWLAVNAHYLNTTPDVLTPTVTINLETIPEDQVETEGGLLFWYNPFIVVPGASSAAARTRCTIDQDISIQNAQSHMHSRGVGYVAELRPGGDDSQVSTFYENTHWEEVPVQLYGEGLEVKAGDTIEYECAYQNPDSHDIYQGPRTTDEMCMFIGTYYPRVPSLDNCSTQNGRPMIGMDWVGTGTKTCDEAYSCTLAAVTGPREGTFEKITNCVLSSRPEVSREISAAVRCLFENRQDALTVCTEQFDTCKAM